MSIGDKKVRRNRYFWGNLQILVDCGQEIASRRDNRNALKRNHEVIRLKQDGLNEKKTRCVVDVPPSARSKDFLRLLCGSKELSKQDAARFIDR